VIGVFDSGLGGLSVLAALIDVLPAADFVYYADTAHVPYGDKPDEFIQQRVLTIGNELINGGCKVLVVACNTATAAAVQALRDAHPTVPVVGVEPGIKPAAASSLTRRIAVLATPSTARSARLQALVERHADSVTVKIEPCPDWATHVETLSLTDPRLVADVRQRIDRLLEWGADRIVLGCTHYSFLTPMISPLLADKAELIEVSEAVARQTHRLASTLPVGRGTIQLRASARVEQLRAALPTLKLDYLLPRLVPIYVAS
jgi:glutamate racemase